MKPKLSRDDILPADMVLAALQAKSVIRQDAITIDETTMTKTQPVDVA